MKQLLLGIDIGTSSVKGTVISAAGHVLTQASAAHDLHAPGPGLAEEAPADWWRNTIAVIRACLDHPAVAAEHIAAVGCTGMLPALLLLDEDGRVLRPSIQQNDARAATEIAALQNKKSADYFFTKTGSSLSQQSIGPKLLWLQTHEPHLWRQTRTILGSYDYINFRLTGMRSIEANWALESGLYDIHDQAWSAELLALCRTPRELLPPVNPPSRVIGAILPRAAEETGLHAGTPVVAGTADHVGAAFAAGIIADGDLLLKFGSAGDILYSSDALVLDPRLYIDYHNIPGKYLLNGCMATSGSFIKWLAREFYVSDGEKAAAAGQSIYAYLDQQATTIPAGSDGLIVLPYLLGEKTPILDPHARGVFYGLTLYHTRRHLYRAALESIAFGFRHHVEVLKEQGQMSQRVVTSEGGARSPLWRQIAADVLNMPVAYLQDNPGASLAAAYVAGMGVGAFASWSDISQFVQIAAVTTPNPQNQIVYDHNFAQYREIYNRLKGIFPA